MSSQIKATTVALAAVLVSTGLSLLLPGCSQCAADCVGGVTFAGDIDVVVAEKPPITIKACYESDCREEALIYQAGGSIACDGYLECKLTEAASGKAHLEVFLESTGEALQEHGQASIHVARSDDNTVLADKSATLTGIEENSICGQTCTSAEVTW